MDQPSAGIVQDGIQREPAGPAVQNSQDWFHMLVESLHDGVVFVNDCLSEILGYSKDELMHMSTLDFAAPEEKERLVQEMQAARRKDEPLQVLEFWAIRQDGGRRYLHNRFSTARSGDRIARLFLVISDITEQKQVEESLKEQQSFLRQIIDLNPNLIFVKDRDSRFVLGNHALAQIYGTTVEDLIGKSDADFTPDPEQAERFHLDDLRVMDSVQESVMPDRPLTDAQGGLHWVQAIKRPLVDADGVARHILGVSVDITERNRLEQQIRDSLARRGQQVQTSTEVAQEIAAAPALQDLYQRVVTLIKERFGYYHAQIFRYEPAVDALLLVTGYGEPGRILLAAGHRLPLGRGVVGAAAAARRAVLASDVGQDTDWVPNPHLPATKGELAVPIILRDQVLGILDVQSDMAGALTADDRMLLEGLCGQIAIAIESTRLRQEMEESLHELERLYRVMSHTGWETLQREIGLTGYLFDLGSVISITDDQGPEGEQPAEQQGPGSWTTDGHSAVVAPLAVRGEIIGSLGIQQDPSNPLSADDLALLESVAEQVAQAMESARLFEQTRLRAEELAVLNEMSRNLTTMANEDEVIESLYHYASRLLDTTNFYVALYDAQGDRVTFPLYVEGKNVQGQMEERRAGKGMTEYVIRTRTPLLIKKDFSRQLAELGVEIIGQEAESWLGVPMMIGENTLGVIVVQSYTTPYVYDEHHRDLLSAIGSQAAVAIENIRLMEQTRRRAEREHTVRTITDRVRRGTNREAILRIALQELSQVLGASTSVARLGTRDQLLSTVEYEPHDGKEG
jgi:PAS domain S-box-containing protein